MFFFKSIFQSPKIAGSQEKNFKYILQYLHVMTFNFLVPFMK